MPLPDIEGALAALDTASFSEPLTEVRHLLSATHRPLDRLQYVPGHLTASAFVVAPDRRHVLLVHHAKLGRWLQPGGHVEPDDLDHESAARREVAEECGLRDLRSLGPLDLDIHTFPARGDVPEHLHFDLRWAFVSSTEDAVVGDGVSAVRWFRFDETVGMEPSVARPVARLAGSLAGQT